MNIIRYYLIRGSVVGKREQNEGSYPKDFIFRNGKWVSDDRSMISDRLVGYDASEPADSPYRFGSMSVMEEIEEISENDAMTLIADKTVSGKQWIKI